MNGSSIMLWLFLEPRSHNRNNYTTYALKSAQELDAARQYHKPSPAPSIREGGTIRRLYRAPNPLGLDQGTFVFVTVDLFPVHT